MRRWGGAIAAVGAVGLALGALDGDVRARVTVAGAAAADTPAADTPADDAPAADTPAAWDWAPIAADRDPFVLRCVLDERPRSVAVALGDDLWASWDATTCRLVKVWRGGVNFTGAVYDTRHGPQPVSEGDDLVDPFCGLVVVDESAATRARPLPATYRGYRLEHEATPPRVTLLYDVVVAPDGAAVRVEETLLAFAARDRDAHALMRRFVVRGAADEAQPGLALETSASPDPGTRRAALHEFFATDASGVAIDISFDTSSSAHGDASTRYRIPLADDTRVFVMYDAKVER